MGLAGFRLIFTIAEEIKNYYHKEEHSLGHAMKE